MASHLSRHISHTAVRVSLAVAVLTVVVIAVTFGQAPHNNRAVVLPPPYATPSATNLPTVVGWPHGSMPRAPSGFRVDLFADDVPGARWLYVLPNNDVLAAQSRTEKLAGLEPDVVDALKKAGGVGPSPNQITLLRDGDGDGRFEIREVFLSGLSQPFGMLLVNDDFYVANTDSVVRYRYVKDARRLTDTGEKIVDLPAGGYNNHWTRNIVASPKGDKLYISVGSQTNVDEEGLDAKEPRRAAILECAPDGSGLRVFASGLRNPNGMDWAPGTVASAERHEVFGRPVGLAMLRDGALIVADDASGRVWRVRYSAG